MERKYSAPMSFGGRIGSTYEDPQHAHRRREPLAMAIESKMAGSSGRVVMRRWNRVPNLLDHELSSRAWRRPEGLWQQSSLEENAAQGKRCRTRMLKQIRRSMIHRVA